MSHKTEVERREIAPYWWPQQRRYGALLWPPEHMSSNRLKRTLLIARRHEDSDMVRRIECILNNRDTAHLIGLSRRKYGLEMHLVLTALKARMESHEGFAELLEMQLGVDWLIALDAVLKMVEVGGASQHDSTLRVTQREAQLRQQIKSMNKLRKKQIARTKKLRHDMEWRRRGARLSEIIEQKRQAETPSE